ncbi:MAG: ABC transporter permease subunit [Ethanoligenens sp.]
MGFLKLVGIENFKMWKRISVRIMLLLMVVLAILLCGLSKYVENKDNPKHTAVTDVANWKEKTQQEVTAYTAVVQAAEKSKNTIDKMSLDSNKINLAEAKYRLVHNIPPKTGLTSVWGWMIKMEDSGSVSGYPMSIAVITLFSLIFVAASVAGEFTEGTMKMMIARPYSRAQILTAKLASTILYALTLLGVFAVVQFIGMGILFGFGDLGAKELFWTGSSVVNIPAVVKLLAVYGLDMLTMLFYVIFGLFLSTLFRSRSLVTGAALFMLLIGSGICMTLAIFFDWVRYIAFGISTFAQYVLRGSLIPGATLGFALAVCGIYTAVFLAGGYFSFLKRDI